MELLKIIKYPLSTEKAIRLMESENKLVFVVDEKAKKEEIAKAISDEYGAKVDNVKTVVDQKGRKKAYVKFAADVPAIDIATKLGLM